MRSLSPFYKCGYDPLIADKYLPWKSKTMSTYACSLGWPLPVVPVAHIIDLINNRFNVDIKTCRTIDFNGGTKTEQLDYQREVYVDSSSAEESGINNSIKSALNNTNYSKVFDLGVVPCVKAQPATEMCKSAIVRVVGLVPVTFNTGMYTFTFDRNYNNIYLKSMVRKFLLSGEEYNVLIPRWNFMNLSVNGFVEAYFDYDDVFKDTSISDGNVFLNVTTTTIKFKQNKGGDEIEELYSLDGVYHGTETYNGTTYAVVRFDMQNNYGMNDAKLENLAYGNEHPQTVTNSGEQYRGIVVYFEGAIPKAFKSVDLKFTPYFNEGGRPRPMSSTFSLPEIKCIDFIKAMFYMDGGFPKLNEDDSIGIIHYTDVLKNIKNGKVYNWSKLIVENDDEIGYNDNYGQNNLYMSGSDSANVDDEITTEGYKNYKLNIECKNKNLDETNEVVTLPFYAPYVTNPNFNAIETGGTFKYWDMEKVYAYDASKNNFTALFKAEESKPFFGYLSYKVLNEDRAWYGLDSNGDQWNGNLKSGANILTMKPWEGIETNNNYVLLKNIIKLNNVIKTKIKISPIDLYSIDYAKPVFIEKYNSYFAIVNIEFRSENGISDVELIKIPM